MAPRSPARGLSLLPSACELWDSFRVRPDGRAPPSPASWKWPPWAGRQRCRGPDRSRISAGAGPVGLPLPKALPQTAAGPVLPSRRSLWRPSPPRFGPLGENCPASFFQGRGRGCLRRSPARRAPRVWPRGPRRSLRSARDSSAQWFPTLGSPPSRLDRWTPEFLSQQAWTEPENVHF